MTHQETNDAVRQSLIGRPRDTYAARLPPIPSRETQIAAVKVNAALGFMEVSRHVGVAADQAKAEFEQAKQELRACVNQDVTRSREARS